MNNAGIMATPAGTTKEGYEIQVSRLHLRRSNLLTKAKFGTNHIGHVVSLRQSLGPEQHSRASKPIMPYLMTP